MTRSKTFTEFYQSIDWAPLERQAIMHFRAPHYLGWEVAKLGELYEANRRAADATDEPVIKTESLETLARWLFRNQAYLDDVWEPGPARVCFNCEGGTMRRTNRPEPGWYCATCDTFLPDDQDKPRPGL